MCKEFARITDAAIQMLNVHFLTFCSSNPRHFNKTSAEVLHSKRAGKPKLCPPTQEQSQFNPHIDHYRQEKILKDVSKAKCILKVKCRKYVLKYNSYISKLSKTT